MEWLIQRALGWAAEIQLNYGVNPIIFGVLYFGTIPPYIYAWAKVAASVKGKDVQTINRWLTVVVIIFTLPYAYVLLFGRNLSVVFYVAVSVLIVLLAWRAIGRLRRLRQSD